MAANPNDPNSYGRYDTAFGYLGFPGGRAPAQANNPNPPFAGDLLADADDYFAGDSITVEAALAELGQNRYRDWGAIYDDSLMTVSQYDAPTLVWSNSMTTALSSPVIYKPAIVGTGVQVNNWNGLTAPVDPNFLWSPGNFVTGNGGQNDLEMHGNNKRGENGYPWIPIVEFDTNSQVIEIAFYTSGQANQMMISVNGKSLTNSTWEPGVVLTNDRKLTITFPSLPLAANRRIRIEGANRVAEFRVNTGKTITKPADTISRRFGVIGDSIVNGSGSATADFPSGSAVLDTHAAHTLRALGVQQPVYAGVGGSGFTAGNVYQNGVAALVTFGLNALIVYGSVNDPQNGAGVQAAASTFLSSVSSIPVVICVGPAKSGWEACGSALKAAAQAAGRPYISLDAFVYGLNGVSPKNPGLTGNNAYFLNGDGSNVHLTQLGHKVLGRYVFTKIAPMLAAL